MDWIVENGGMALVSTHPDHMNFGEERMGFEEYPAEFYEKFLRYVKFRHDGVYWSALPKSVAMFYKGIRKESR